MKVIFRISSITQSTWPLKGVELVVARCGELLECVTERTRLVAISTVNYSNGYTAPVREIGEVLRERGILFFLDGTQSVGALQIDLGTVQPDMFAVNAYKWLLSPNGAGFLYVAPGLRAKLDPSVIGWRSDKNWRSVNALHNGAPRFAESAEKYEAGMLDFAALYAMADTIDMMLEIGTGIIEARVLELGQCVREIVQRKGASVLYEGSPIVSAAFADAPAIAARLKEQGIITAARHGRLRISPHFYNNEADLDHFADVLGRVL